jgi:sphinganine-1-phosphate aldolase
MTSGGTESILLAMKTYRNWAHKKKGMRDPEIILPISAHPAFDKAADYFNLKKIHIPLTEDFRVDINAVNEAISENIIGIVGSACDFPRGVVDPIAELAAIAKENEIGCHVDACLGGFMLPWLKQLGYVVPDFDLSVPGVTSISADLHKYGYTAKGASVVLYKSKKLQKYQVYAYTEWPGGIYASATMTGTRPGAAVAAAWAGLKVLGGEGYLQLAKVTMETTKRFIDGINSIPELYVMGKPDMTVFSFSSDVIDMYILGDIMQRKGWLLDRLQFPPCLHIIITPQHAKIVSQFLKDLKESVEELKANPLTSAEGTVAMYGMMARHTDRKTIEETVIRFLMDQYDL